MTAPKVRHLTQEELAEREGVSPWTVKGWRRFGTGPDYIRVHRRKVLYPLARVEAWERQRLVST